MRRIFTFIAVLFVVQIAIGQATISYHVSSQSFIGFNYEIQERFIPEFRVDAYASFENIGMQFNFSYIFIKTGNADIYAGLGTDLREFDAVIIPVGINFYPFEKKNAGFHVEVATIIEGEAFLRSSFGIRYRFGERN